jgi:hypothetical protein
MAKNRKREACQLPQIQREITSSNNSASEFIKLSECIPIELELSLFKDCFDVFGDTYRYAAGGCVNAFF